MNIEEIKAAWKKEKKFTSLLEPKSVEFFSTGSLALDAAIGGGWPDRIIEIYSPESGGKTTLALEACTQIQKLGHSAAYIDMEHTLDPDYATQIGVNVEELMVVQPEYGEQALDVLEDLVERKVRLIVVDSVAALVPKAEYDADMEANSVGLQARMMGKALRKINSQLSGTTVIFINQIREKVGVLFGSPETCPGGRALPFYASVRVRLGSAGKVEGDGEQTGKRIRAKVMKNKVGVPFKEAEFDLIFGKGIDKASELLDIVIDRGIITRGGAWFTTDTGDKLQGRDNAKTWVSEHEQRLRDLLACSTESVHVQA